MAILLICMVGTRKNENLSSENQVYAEAIERAFENSNISIYASNQNQTSEDEKYPDYYGGAYIDEETGGLVVLVKEDEIDLKSAATEIADITQEITTISSESVKNGIRIEPCEVSCNEIDAVIDFLSDQINDLQSQGVEITEINKFFWRKILDILILISERVIGTRSIWKI